VYDTEESIYKKNDLKNDITLFYPYGTLSNRIIYNNDIKKITSSATTLKSSYNGYFANIYYTYTRDKTTLDTQKNIQYDLGLSFARYYKISYKDEYDITNKISKKKEYLFNINKKCWAVNFKLVDSLVASSTINDETLRQNILYMEFNLKQLFKLNQKYKFKERVQ
jgi:hypothetical protein